MRVRLKTLYAGPSGVTHPGQIVDLPAAEAVALLNGGYADAVDAPPIETAVPPEYERAVRRGRNSK